VHRIGFSSKKKLSVKQWEGSYPHLLREAGYYTGLVGKWHINMGKGAKLEKFFDVYMGHKGHGSFLFDQKGGSADKGEVEDPSELVTTNRKKTDDAFKFLDSVPEGKPFCLSLCYATPHSSKFRVMWKEYDKPSFNNPNLKDHPIFGTEGPYRDLGIKTPLDADPNPYDHIPREVIDHDKGRNSTYSFCYDKAMCYELHMRYFQMVTEIDEMIGEIVSELEKRQLSEKTLVIFASDHGLMMGDHGMGGKGLLYDLTVKFPCFIYDPQASQETKGLKRQELVSSLDITSTILDYAGVEQPAHMVGSSLKPLLEKKESPAGWRQGLVLESLFMGRDGPIQDGYVTADGWKYIRYSKQNRGNYSQALITTGQDPDFEQLFNLNGDPTESKNEIANPAQNERVKELMEKTEAGVADLLEQYKRYNTKF